MCCCAAGVLQQAGSLVAGGLQPAIAHKAGKVRDGNGGKNAKNCYGDDELYQCEAFGLLGIWHLGNLNFHWGIIAARSGFVLSWWMTGSESAITGWLLVRMASHTVLTDFALVQARLPGAHALDG